MVDRGINISELVRFVLSTAFEPKTNPSVKQEIRHCPKCRGSKGNVIVNSGNIYVICGLCGQTVLLNLIDYRPSEALEGVIIGYGG